MGLQTQHFDDIRVRKYYDYFNLGCLITPNAAAGAEGDLLGNPLDATVYLGEVNPLGIVGILFAANADKIYPRFRVPYDLDPKHAIGFRLNFTQSAAVSVGVTWTLEIGTDKAGAVQGTIAALVALDTVLTEKNAGGVGDENLWTNRGIKNAIGLTRGDIEDGAVIRLECASTTIDGTITALTLMGIEIDYVPIRTKGPGHGSNVPLKTDGTS